MNGVGGRATTTGADGRTGIGARVLLVVLAVYFFVPLAAMARFALQRVPVVSLGWDDVFDRWSFADLVEALTDPRTVETARRSLVLVALTVVLTLALLLPVAVVVELHHRRWKPVVVVLTLAPWVVPPIALVVGVAGTFRTAAPWFLGSPYSLVPFYAMWAMPFGYRALDAGLRAIDVRTLHEAARSLGCPMPTFVLRVLAPNLASSLIVVATLTGATVLGEFAFASLLLKETLPTHLVVLQAGEPRAGLALALVVLLLSAAAIGAAVAVLRRRGVAFNGAGI